VGGRLNLLVILGKTENCPEEKGGMIPVTYRLNGSRVLRYFPSLAAAESASGSLGVAAPVPEARAREIAERVRDEKGAD